MTKRLALFAHCIEEGQKQGEINQVCSAYKLAQLFVCGWNGAYMHAKTEKNIEAMETFIDLMFNHFLKA